MNFEDHDHPPKPRNLRTGLYSPRKTPSKNGTTTNWLYETKTQLLETATAKEVNPHNIMRVTRVQVPVLTTFYLFYFILFFFVVAVRLVLLHIRVAFWLL